MAHVDHIADVVTVALDRVMDGVQSAVEQVRTAEDRAAIYRLICDSLGYGLLRERDLYPDGGAGAVTHEGLPDLQGGAEGEHFHLTQAQAAHAALAPWKLRWPVDVPPGTPTAWDDEFGGAAVDEKWSWINQNAATAALADGLLRLSSPYRAENADALSAFVQGVPSGDCEFTACCASWGTAFNSNSGYYRPFGLVVGGAAVTDPCSTLYLKFNAGGPHLDVHDRVDYQDTWGAQPVVTYSYMNHFRVPLYFRWARTGSTWTWSWSQDGDQWEVVRTAAAACAVEKVGLVCDNINHDTVALINWFRRTA